MLALALTLFSTQAPSEASHGLSFICSLTANQMYTNQSNPAHPNPHSHRRTIQDANLVNSFCSLSVTIKNQNLKQQENWNTAPTTRCDKWKKDFKIVESHTSSRVTDVSPRVVNNAALEFHADPNIPTRCWCTRWSDDQRLWGASSAEGGGGQTVRQSRARQALRKDRQKGHIFWIPQVCRCAWASCGWSNSCLFSCLPEISSCKEDLFL